MSRGELSLSCYCGAGGSCPPYETALAWCKDSTASTHLEEYAGCNLVAIRVGGPGNSYTYVYDLTTKGLVGVEDAIQGAPARVCGSNGVYRLVAGRLPESTCMGTRWSDKCAGLGRLGGNGE